MRKESVQKFDLEAAFKALNEVEIPVVKGIRPNREDLQERFTRKLVTDILVEDYYDVGDTEELGQAQEEREAEIAKAKLARIEKIVDLEAETEEDLLPSYVGKLIIQCPQCMTLFYKNEEDIERSEENPDVVNLNEPCQHCGNSSGYTLIGKVDTVGEDEAAQYDAEDFEENELDLDFDEEEATEEPEESTDEVATEEETEGEEIDLEPMEDEEAEEEVQESLREDWDAEVANADKRLEEIVKESGNENYDDGDGYWSGEAEWCNRYMYYANSVANREKVEELCNKYSTDSCTFYVTEDDAEEDPISEIGYTLIKGTNESLNEATINISKAEMAKLDKEVEEATKEVAKYKIPMKAQQNSACQTENVPDFDAVPEDQREAAKKAYDRYQKAYAARPDRAKNIINYTDESLNEGIDKDLDDKLKAHNDYIDYLKKMIEDEEAALAKANNEYVKKSIQRRLEAFKADLEEALPAELKNEVDANEELPTPEEVDMEAAAENKDDNENKNEKTEKKESLTEDLDAEQKLEDEEAALESSKAEDYIVEATTNSVMQALDNLESELTEEAELTEAKFDEVSDADFKAMLNNPVFNEACKNELEEDLPPVNDAAFDKATDAIEAAGSELTPEEQRLEDEELAAKEGVEESLTESAEDLLADDGTLAMLIYPDRFTADVRKERLLADPAFVKALEIFATEYKMMAKPEDLEDGVTPEEDMYNCTFEGIEGEDLEATLDELISYYLDVKAEDGLTEAAPQGEFVSKLKRNYSATEVMVKELKADPMFSGLSTRTIQRILLPYYISVMGRAELSTQSMIDFFAEEGFATYVLDHFFTMDPLARKELLKADPKFMEIFNAFAKEYDLFPGKDDAREPGESDFDFALKVAFDFDEEGNAQDNDIANETIQAFSRWYAAGKFDKQLVADMWESVEDFDENEFNKLTEQYLTNVYSNVKSFETTGCNLEDNKLIIEGMIKFASGKIKNTTFTYEAKRAIGKHLVLEGLNADFATEKAFVLNCKVDTENCLIVESLNYKYTINNTLVEGLLK